MIYSCMIVNDTRNSARCVDIQEAAERYDLRWLLMTQTTVAAGGLSKKLNERYDFAWLSVKQTIDQKGWKSMKQCNDMILNDYLSRKRMITIDVYP